VLCLLRDGVMVDIWWVKSHEGTPGNERTDLLAGQAADSHVSSTACLKLHTSLKNNEGKAAWNRAPGPRQSPLPAKEELPGQERHHQGGIPNPHRPLDVRSIPQGNWKPGLRYLPVLPEAGPYRMTRSPRIVAARENSSETTGERESTVGEPRS
jgi:hypothetical protein